MANEGLMRWKYESAEGLSWTVDDGAGLPVEVGGKFVAGRHQNETFFEIGRFDSIDEAIDACEKDFYTHYADLQQEFGVVAQPVGAWRDWSPVSCFIRQLAEQNIKIEKTEDITVYGMDSEDGYATPRWNEMSPGEWIFETEFGCLRVDAGDDYRSEGDAAFLAYWDWDETFEIGYYDTIEEAKEACMKDLMRRVKPLAVYMGFDRSLDCEHPDTTQLKACLNAANGANEDEDFKPGPEYIAVANLSDTFHQLRDAFERLCQDAVKWNSGYFYCYGTEAEKCPWRKEGVRRCIAPEGYNCQAESIEGTQVGITRPEKINPESKAGEDATTVDATEESELNWEPVFGLDIVSKASFSKGTFYIEYHKKEGLWDWEFFPHVNNFRMYKILPKVGSLNEARASAVKYYKELMRIVGEKKADATK